MTTSLRTAMITAPLVVVGGLALAACSSSGGTPSGHRSSQPAAVSTPAPAGKTVTATETEFHIALSSKKLTPGTYTFRDKNAGTITHALTVNGPGVNNKSTGDLNPGQSATLTVTLNAGTYHVYCPVGNHKMEGMDETVQVG